MSDRTRKVVVLGETAGSHVVDAPQGAFDLQVQTEDGTIGFAHGVLALGDAFSLLVPMELPTLLEPCSAGDKRERRSGQECAS